MVYIFVVVNYDNAMDLVYCLWLCIVLIDKRPAFCWCLARTGYL